MYVFAFLAWAMPVAEPPGRVGSATPSQVVSTACSLYDPRPECTDAERNALRKRFGLPRMTTIRKRTMRNGSERIIGIMTLKRGKGLALIFERNRDGGAEVTAHLELSWKSRSRTQPLRAKISEAEWRSIADRGRALNDVHAWDHVYVCGAQFSIEFVDAKGIVRAPVGDGCNNEPRGLYFDVLAAATIKQLPHCAALQPNTYDDDSMKLIACLKLKSHSPAAIRRYNREQRAEDER